MTEKRYYLYEHKDYEFILDDPNTHLDFIEMLGDALTSEEIVDRLNALHEENQRFQENLNKSVFVNFDSDDGCHNCKYQFGGFCEILLNPVANWLKGVSKCDLKKWELKE